MTTKDTDYIAQSMADKVIAKTKLLGGGESDAIEFSTAPGTYDFICTFPDHSGIMKGKLIVSGLTRWSPHKRATSVPSVLDRARLLSATKARRHTGVRHGERSPRRDP